MSPEWRRMLRFAIAEADRLGLRVSVNLSSCAGALKGPWEVGADAPKELAWTATSVRDPRRLDCQMRRPARPNFHDIALLAVRPSEAPSVTNPVAGNPMTTVAMSETWIVDVAGTGACVAVEGEAIDLSEKTDAEGRLTWDVPEGSWTLLRFGTSTMAGHEFDVDVLDPKAVAGHFGRMGGAILKDAGPLAGTTLTHFYSVSWEGAAPTWTPALGKEFAAYRGYALRPWLPALAGFAIRSPEASGHFRRDYFKTLGDCFMNNFYGTLRDLTRKAGLQWHSESGGPWDRKLAAFEHADQLAFLGRNDMPQGEFWFPGRGKMGRPPDMNRPAAMAAHIHGLRLAARVRPSRRRLLRRHASEPQRDVVAAGRPVPRLPRPLPVDAPPGRLRGGHRSLCRRPPLPALGPQHELESPRHAGGGSGTRLRPPHNRGPHRPRRAARRRTGAHRPRGRRRSGGARDHALPRARHRP